jgi:hypothetical protein
MNHKQLVLAIGTALLGLGAFGVSVQATAQKCTSEACACEEALRQNTVEALEAFLKKYPHSYKGDSACAALAVPPSDGLEPENPDAGVSIEDDEPPHGS